MIEEQDIFYFLTTLVYELISLTLTSCPPSVYQKTCSSSSTLNT